MTGYFKKLTPWITSALIIAVAVLAGLATQRYAITFDWTAGHRNSLTPASQRVLKALDHGPITFTAYFYPGTDRTALRDKLSRYTRAADRVHLVFRDPARYPQKVRQLGIGSQGAVVVSYQGRTTTITNYDEPSVTHALMRLSPGGDPWVLFVTGHGERDPNATNAAGYQRLASALDAQGMRVRTLNLASAGAIPSNTGLLVIASPQKTYLPGEVTMIKQYVARGGRLLWVDDPGNRDGLVPLAAALGVHFDHGTLLYPEYRALGTQSPEIAIVATYPDTPITRDINQITVFPFAGALSASGNSSWQPSAFLRSPPNSWLETGPLDGSTIRFQPDHGDLPGPLTIGLLETRAAPTRDVADRSKKNPGSQPAEQRVVIVANSTFMDNSHIDLLGNRTLALAIFQWLVGRDNQIAINIPTAVDAHLEMTPSRLPMLRWLFVAALPLLLVAIGATRWLIRRRR